MKDAEPSALLTALVFLGALFCSLPLLGFLGLGLGEVLMRTAAGYFVGAMGVAAALWWLRTTRHIFATCIALEMWGLGLALMLVRWLDDSSGGESAVLVASAFLSVAVLVSARMTAALWVVRLMGVMLTSALLVTLTMGFKVAGGSGAMLQTVAHVGLSMLGLGWAWWCWQEADWLGQPGAERRCALADGFAVGVLVCGLAVNVWWDSPLHVLGRDIDGASYSGNWLLGLPRWMAAAMALGGGWALMRRWSVVGLMHNGWKPLLSLACAVLAVAAWFSPGIGAVAVVLAVSAASARWRLFTASCLVVLALLSSFYYNLTWSLAAKGLGLMLMGSTLALVLGALAARSRRPSEPSHPMADSRSGVAWVLLGGVLALGLANVDVWRKESVIAEGQRILVPLVPVDPRSLMQGDYMQLRFAIPQPILNVLNESPAYSMMKRAEAVARLDTRGEAELLRLASPDLKLEAGEILLPLKQLKGQWVLVTDAYFFPEGEGARFEQARFGEFRALANGRALLVGLTDAEGRSISAGDGRPGSRALPAASER